MFRALRVRRPGFKIAVNAKATPQNPQGGQRKPEEIRELVLKTESTRHHDSAWVCEQTQWFIDPVLRELRAASFLGLSLLFYREVFPQILNNVVNHDS